jgi:hypothetical protein
LTLPLEERILLDAGTKGPLDGDLAAPTTTIGRRRKEGTPSMRTAALALAFCFVAGAARASPVLFSPAAGPPNVVGAERSGFWSEPADLNGLIGSSEQILSFGFETELANDFVVDPSETVQVASWWGGYYNVSTPCVSGISAPGFNLRFYADAGSVPGPLVADVAVTYYSEQSLGCQAGTACPLFKWTADVNASFGGGRYWFAPQMMDHGFPPQWGRLASGFVRDNESCLRSYTNGFPDWTTTEAVFGVAFDCSQEFDCMICGGDQGSSDVGELPARALQKASWGEVKGLFR